MKLLSKYTKEEVVEGQVIPRGYAFVRINPASFTYELALIPFNFLLRFYYWFCLKISTPSQRDREIQNALSKGYLQGYEEGKIRGVGIGRSELWDEIVRGYQ